MQWLKNFQLFLFDFDGLLVDSEALHLEAYTQMCQEHGCPLDLDIATYNRVAQFDSTGPKKAIFEKFPRLAKFNWETLRARKVEIYLEKLQQGEIALMPGVAILLQTLEQENIPRCVVTHSKPEQIDPIRKKHPILNTIKYWITRNDYKEPKPHPEGYLKAISMLAKKGDRIIGFEDSPKGLQALAQANVTPVLVSPYFEKKEISPLIGCDFFHIPTLDVVFDLYQE